MKLKEIIILLSVIISFASVDAVKRMRPVDFQEDMPAKKVARVKDAFLKPKMSSEKTKINEFVSFKPETDDEKVFALSSAISKDDIEAVKKLIAEKYPVDFQSKGEVMTPLMQVAQAKNNAAQIAKLLIKSGADLARKNSELTALSWAILAGNFDVIRVLVRAGADLTHEIRHLGNINILSPDTKLGKLAAYIMVINSLDEDFKEFITEYDVSQNELEDFLVRLLNQNNFAKFNEVINFLESDRLYSNLVTQEFKDIQLLLEKYQKYTLDPEAVSYILKEQEDYNNLLESRVYDYAQEQDIKPLVKLLANWALSAQKLLQSETFPREIASHISSYM